MINHDYYFKLNSIDLNSINSNKIKSESSNSHHVTPKLVAVKRELFSAAAGLKRTITPRCLQPMKKKEKHEDDKEDIQLEVLKQQKNVLDAQLSFYTHGKKVLEKADFILSKKMEQMNLSENDLNDYTNLMFEKQDC